nr:ubiquitin hydrolase [Tanacetum cinerariifolium]
MDDPNITMKEYIQLMADKARGRDQTFNCETTTYSKEYCDDLDSFTNFETDFPAIVYNDASTSNQNVSSEPTNIDVKPTDNVNCKDTTPIEFDENIETYQDTSESAQMAISSSSSENEPCYSKACKKNTDSLNSQITELSEKLGDTKNMLYHYKLGLSQVEARLVEFKNQEIKFCEKIRGLEFSVECKANIIENLTKELEELKKEKKGLDSKLTGFKSATKDLDNLIGSQRSNKIKEGLDDTITDYSRSLPTIESNPDDLQNINSSVIETGESLSTILSKPAIKFVKAVDRPAEIKTNKVETAKKSAVKYAEMYRRTSKRSNVRGNQRNWNNLKTQQFGKNFLMKNKACFNCGDFDHLSYDCCKWVEMGKLRPKNNTHQSMPPRTIFHKIDRSPTRINRPNVNSARPRTTQDLMIILIQKVKRLERELKARTPPTKIHKVDRGISRSVMAWVPNKV